MVIFFNTTYEPGFVQGILWASKNKHLQYVNDLYNNR